MLLGEIEIPENCISVKDNCIFKISQSPYDLEVTLGMLGRKNRNKKRHLDIK
jgi:hypothetical protein